MPHSKSSDPLAPGKFCRDENESSPSQVPQAPQTSQASQASQAPPKALPINESSGQSDFELGNWIIPASILLALALLGIWIANRRRNGGQKIVIDTTKPIRGAFRKRNSTPTPTFASSEESFSGNSELRLPREDLQPTNQSASGTEQSFSDEFIPRRKPMTDGATERDFADQQTSESETAEKTSEKKTAHPARPKRNARHSASRLEAHETEFGYRDDTEIEQTEPGLDDPLSPAHQPLKPSLAAQSASRDAGLTELSWKSTDSDAELPEDLQLTPSRAAMLGSMDPSATQDEQPKSGVFKRWFSKRSKDAPDPITPMENTPHEVDKFQIPDEDLRSLFEKSAPESSSTAPLDEFTDFDADFDLPGDQPGDGLGSSPVSDSFDLGPDDSDHRLTQEEDDFILDFDSDESIEDSSMRRQLAQLEANLAQMHLENRQLRESLQMAQRDLEGFTAQQNHQLEEHRMEQETAASELAKHLETIARLEAEQLELLDNRDSLQVEIEERIASVQQVEVERTANSQTTQALHDSLAQLRLELQDVIRQRDSAQQARDQFQSELQVAAPQAEARRAELQQLQTDHLDLQEQLSNSESKLGNLVSQNQALELQVQQLQQAQEEALQQASTWEQQRQTWDAELRQLQTDQRNLNEQLSASQLNFSELNRQNETLELQIRELRQEREQLTSRANLLQQQLSDLATTQAKAADASSSESINRQTKEKFTRLFKSYESERRLRKEAEQFLAEAEQQIVQLREAAKKPKKSKPS